MASHQETINILRKILYITISLFIIFGLTSIGILVDAARKDRPVVLATALVLLSILLAFLVIFVVILCVWRNANQSKRWREERDIESRVLWLPGPANSRYLPTHQELRTLRRQEKRERRNRARQRSIQNAIAAARGRISAPRDSKDGITGRPLAREEVFVARPDPIFGHGAHGIFGARPGLGGGLNPNHGLSPPMSPKSLPRSPARVLVARNAVVPKATVCNFERLGEGMRADADKMVAHGKTKENGSEVSEETEGAVASVSVPTKQISRKEVGTPPRGDKGALRVVNEGVGDGDGGRGAVIGLAGEKVIGMGSERLPSQLNGHGLMAIPPLIKAVQQHNPWQQGTGRRWSSRDSWGRQKGSLTDRRDAAESVPWANKTGILKNSRKALDMFGAMTADEVQAEMKRAEGEAGQGENVRSDAVVEKAENALTRGTQEKIGNYGDAKRGAEELDQGKKTRAERQKMRENLKDERTKAAALARSKREQAETRQAMDRTAEEEQRLRDRTAAQSADHEGRRRKSSETYPMPHLEAIPPRLAIRHEKKGDYGILSAVPGPIDESTLNTPIGQGQAIATPVASSCNPCITYKRAPAATTTNYHPPSIQDEDETEWQAQRRARELSRRNSEEAARLAMVQAFAPSSLPSPPPPFLPSPQPLPPSPPSPAQRPSPVQRWSGEGGASPTGTFSDWHTLYKKDAKDRGVRGFTCTTSTTDMEKNEAFSSFSDVERERGEIAAGVVWTSCQTLAVPSSGNIPDTLPSQRGVVDYGRGVDYGIGMTEMTADEAQAELARMPVRSLHSTERGTTFSLFQPGSSKPAVVQPKSGIPRLTTGPMKTVVSAAAATFRPLPVPGQFGYHNTRKGNRKLARTKAEKGGKMDSGRTGLPREERI